MRSEGSPWELVLNILTKLCRLMVNKGFFTLFPVKGEVLEKWSQEEYQRAAQTMVNTPLGGLAH